MKTIIISQAAGYVHEPQNREPVTNDITWARMNARAKKLTAMTCGLSDGFCVEAVCPMAVPFRRQCLTIMKTIIISQAAGYVHEPQNREPVTNDITWARMNARAKKLTAMTCGLSDGFCVEAVCPMAVPLPSYIMHGMCIKTKYTLTGIRSK